MYVVCKKNILQRSAIKMCDATFYSITNAVL